MWKYVETDAYDSISLHDCRTEDVHIEGTDLVINFPDGFWITPGSSHIDAGTPLKTGPSQVRITGYGEFDVLEDVLLFKSTWLFRREVLCRRIRMKAEDFLRRVSDGKHELEFLYEFHRPGKGLYQCWLWRKDRGMEAECQFEVFARSVEYRWNEILPERGW